jgi:SAM-dependent methyltransferase
MNKTARGVAHLNDLLVREPLCANDGVLDFISATGRDYCDNFGKQWNRFREVQLDSVTTKSESHDRFFAETGWTPAEIKGKLLLDAGCGAGRFAEVALEAGARVVAVDMSEAAWASRETLDRFSNDDYLVLRADLFDLPLRANVFDGIYSLGVIHHTPDPLEAIRRLTRLLAPGGRLSTWIYEKRSPDIRWLQPRTWVRAAVSNRSTSAKLAIAQRLTATSFPLGWTLSWFGRTGERASQFLPYAARHHLGRGDLRRQWGYSVMDTFDWYGPVYEQPQRQQDIVSAMEAAGLINVRRLRARGMASVGEASS